MTVAHCSMPARGVRSTHAEAQATRSCSVCGAPAGSPCRAVGAMVIGNYGAPTGLEYGAALDFVHASRLGVPR